jgi:hypothetical protein
VNLWMKRAIGAAALGGSLLALGAGAASAQEVAADASARLGRPTSAEVRVCADGRVLSRLLGSCSGQSATSATVRAGDGIRARVRVPRTASADASVGTRRSRPAASASGQASAATRPGAATADADASADTSPRARADAAARLSRPRAGRLLDLRPLASLAGVGLVGSSPFTLVGDPASASLVPVGELTLDDPAAEAPAGIGVLDSGPIASGNQLNANIGDVSPSVPVTVCGNGVGVLGDASASCGANQASTAANPAPAGSSSSNPANPSSDSLLDNLASGNQVDAGIGEVSPSVPVMVCGNGVGVLGDASASCGASQPAAGADSAAGSSSGSTGASAGTGSTDGSLLDDIASGNQVDASAGDVSPSVPLTVCGNAVGDASASCAPSQQTSGDGTTQLSDSTSGSGSSGPSGNQGQVSVESVSPSVPVPVCGSGVGLLGDATISCGADTSTGGIIAPPPGTTPGSTDTDGTTGGPGSTGTSGIPGTTTGLTPGTSGGPGDPATTLAPLRPSLSGVLPFTGAASDLLAQVAGGLLVAGVLIVRAARPATAATEGGEDR